MFDLTITGGTVVDGTGPPATAPISASRTAGSPRSGVVTVTTRHRNRIGAEHRRQAAS